MITSLCVKYTSPLHQSKREPKLYSVPVYFCYFFSFFFFFQKKKKRKNDSELFTKKSSGCCFICSFPFDDVISFIRRVNHIRFNKSRAFPLIEHLPLIWHVLYISQLAPYPSIMRTKAVRSLSSIVLYSTRTAGTSVTPDIFVAECRYRKQKATSHLIMKGAFPG